MNVEIPVQTYTAADLVAQRQIIENYLLLWRREPKSHKDGSPRMIQLSDVVELLDAALRTTYRPNPYARSGDA